MWGQGVTSLTIMFEVMSVRRSGSNETRQEKDPVQSVELTHILTGASPTSLQCFRVIATNSSFCAVLLLDTIVLRSSVSVKRANDRQH